jgi:hypothetical protein
VLESHICDVGGGWVWLDLVGSGHSVPYAGPGSAFTLREEMTTPGLRGWRSPRVCAAYVKGVGFPAHKMMENASRKGYEAIDDGCVISSSVS